MLGRNNRCEVMFYKFNLGVFIIINVCVHVSHKLHGALPQKLEMSARLDDWGGNLVGGRIFEFWTTIL